MENQRHPLKSVWLLTVLSGIIDLALTILKLVFGYITNIQSITADGIHSLGDVVADIIVFLFIRISHQPVSRRRPYGQRKLESFAALVMACILVATALWMIREAMADLGHGTEGSPTLSAFLVTLFAIVMKELLFWITLLQGKKVKSAALVANAWHHRSDVLSSLAVLISLVLSSYFGNQALWDLLGVTAVAGMIVKAAWDIARGSFAELFDHAPPADILAKIETLADEDADVVLVHDLRVRTIGGTYHITLNMELDSGKTIGESHVIVTRIKKRITAALPDIFSVLIQVEPAGTYAARLGKIGLENLRDEDLL